MEWVKVEDIAEESKFEMSNQVVNDDSNVKVIKVMNIAKVWWLRLRNVVVRMKWILRVVRLEEMPGAALTMDIRSQQNVELFRIQGESKVAGRMELQGKILNWFGWNEKQELP